jgi:CheY-like chemotaxis protein
MIDATPAKIRVLVIEDRPVQAKLISKMLELLGYEAQSALSAREALTAMRGFKPQVVLLDIGLPDANGYQLADLIHKDLEFKSVPIIAVTGYDRDEDKSKLVGIDLHLVKPITADDLRSAFSRLGLGN